MSSLHRLQLCQFFARPEIAWANDRPGPAADFGTSVHGVIAKSVPSGEPVEHEDPRVRSVARTFMEWFDARERHQIGGAGWLAEPAYVLDLGFGEARLIGCNIERKYPELGQYDVAGSADLVGDGGDGSAVCIDVKTGRRENVEPCADNAQMKTLSLAVRRAHGADKVRAVLAFAGPGGVAVDEHTFYADDLDRWESELVSLAEAIPTSEPRTGKHCAYCPAKSACPAMGNALATMVPAPATAPRKLPIVTAASAIQDMDHARYQYETLRAAKTAIDAAWTAVRLYAEEKGAIDLGDGRFYGPKETKREAIELDSAAAVEVLKSELGESWQLAVTLETSKTAIRDASRDRSKVEGKKIAEVERRVLDGLRAVGAVRTNVSTTFDEYKALTEGKTDAA